MYWPFIVMGLALIAFGWWMPTALRKGRHTAASRGENPERIDALIRQWWMRAFPHFATAGGLFFIVVGLGG